MKTCSTCGHEYLDSYGGCPFCARAAAVGEEPSRLPVSTRRVPYLRMTIGTTVMLVLVFAAWQIFAAYFGNRAVLASQAAGCFAKQVEAERAVLVYAATHDDVLPGRFADLVPAQLERAPACPAGGTLTLKAAPQQPKITCSKHGWHGDSER